MSTNIALFLLFLIDGVVENTMDTMADSDFDRWLHHYGENRRWSLSL